MNVKKFLNIFIVIAAIALFVTVLSRALLYSPDSDITVPVADAIMQPAAKGNYPVRLSIPSIGVDAKVQQVGIAGNGNMAVPTNFTDVGWYEYGTVPGQAGSAVIDGHVDDGLAFPAVFANLDQLQAGNTIVITMSSGTVLHYVVTGSQAYDKDDTDTAAIFNDNNGKIIQLITCTGSWLPLQRTHTERLVVTAVEQ